MKTLGGLLLLCQLVSVSVSQMSNNATRTSSNYSGRKDRETPYDEGYYYRPEQDFDEDVNNTEGAMTFLMFCLIIALGMTFVFYTKCCKYCGFDIKKLCSKCRSKRQDGQELKLRTSLRVQLAEYYRNGPGNGKTEIKLQRRSWRVLIKEELGESVYKDMQAPSMSINTIIPYDFNTQGNLMGAS